MKKMRCMKIMVMLFVIFISCFTKNIFASDMSDIVEEKIDPSENIIEEFGEEEESLELFSNVVGIDWTIKDGVRKKTKQFYKKKGSSITIDFKISPETKSVRVGYLDADQVKHYKTVKAKIKQNFTIQKTGYIKVFVENNSGKTVTVTGSYIK